MKARVRRVIACIFLVLSLSFTVTPTPVHAQTDWCNYFVGQYAWYEWQYNRYMNFYFASGDDFYRDIAEMYFQQMVNLVPAIEDACGGFGPRP